MPEHVASIHTRQVESGVDDIDEENKEEPTLLIDIVDMGCTAVVGWMSLFFSQAKKGFT